MNLRLRTLFVVASLFALAATSFGAQRQLVIVDNFTQWNCGPCASWNPTESALTTSMTRDTVLVIKTHGWWPGANNDAFHLWNVSESTARINYYGCNWVPWVMCDGIIDIRNVNISTLRNGIRQRYATPSPCTIDNLLAVTTTPTGIAVSGTINAEQALSNAYLYVVLIRDEVNYPSPPGSNGETHFPNVFCDAAPNFSTGTLVTASPGNPYNFNVNLNRDAGWDVENLSVVAFLQNNGTKEVYQATWGHVTQDYAFSATENNAVQAIVQPDGGERAYPISVSNTGLQNDTYAVTLSGDWPTGWSYSVEEMGGTSDPSSINVPVNSQGSTSLVVRVNPNGYPGHAQFAVHMESGGNDLVQANFAWRLMAGLDILVVDADGGAEYETYYAEALDAVDENIDVVWGWWDTSLDDLEATMFDGLDVLIWFTGDLWSEAVTPIDQLNLTDYLDAGGNLLMTGQGLGFDLRTDQLFTDYMHARWLRNFPIGVSVTGVEGTAGSGLAFSVVGGDGANNQSRQAAVEARDGMATVIMNYDQEYQGAVQGAGLTVDDGNYRVMYLAFGLEAISNAADRAAMMGNAVNWLITGAVSTPDAPEALPTEFSLMQNYPNPFNPETNIPFALPVRSTVKLSVFDMLGREVATLADGPFEAGSHTVNWNASELSSGVYFYRLDAQGGQQSFNSTRKIVLMK